MAAPVGAARSRDLLSKVEIVCIDMRNTAFMGMGIWLGVARAFLLFTAPLTIAGLVFAISTGRTVSLLSIGATIEKVAGVTFAATVVAGMAIGFFQSIKQFSDEPPPPPYAERT